MKFLLYLFLIISLVPVIFLGIIYASAFISSIFGTEPLGSFIILILIIVLLVLNYSIKSQKFKKN